MSGRLAWKNRPMKDVKMGLPDQLVSMRIEAMGQAVPPTMRSNCLSLWIAPAAVSCCSKKATILASTTQNHQLCQIQSPNWSDCCLWNPWSFGCCLPDCRIHCFQPPLETSPDSCVHHHLAAAAAVCRSFATDLREQAVEAVANLLNGRPISNRG